MTIEDRVYDVFDRKLTEIEDEIDRKISPRWRSMARVQEEWSDFLKSVPGINAMGMISALVIECDEDEVRVKNPLVVAGNQGFISMSRATAMKIATLGFLPGDPGCVGHT